MPDILEMYLRCRHWVNGKCHTSFKNLPISWMGSSPLMYLKERVDAYMWWINEMALLRTTIIYLFIDF